MRAKRNASALFVCGMVLWLAAGLASASLVAYYPLDGNANAVVGPNGMIVGSPATVAGQVGTALDFNGSSDYVDVGAGVMPGGSYSIAAWVNPHTLAGIQYIGGVQNSSNSGGRLFRFASGTTAEMYHVDSLGSPSGHNVVQHGLISTSTWVHLAATFDHGSNMLRLYVNGDEKDSDPTGGNSNFVCSNFKIARRPDGTGANWLDGAIDDVAVYSHALTPSEVSTIHSSGVLALEAQRANVQSKGPYTADAHTLHLFHLDETTGNYLDTGTGVTKNQNVIGGTRGTFAPVGLGNSFTVTTSDLGNNSLTKGVTTATADAQSLYQGADGAFTYEALISVSTLQIIASEQLQIISREDDGGLTDRSFQFRINNGDLQLVGLNVGNVQTLSAAIPGTGDHAFEPNEWFHVAVTYDGDPSNTENVKLYWTRLYATTANLIGTAQLTADLSGSDNGIFSIGSMRRSAFRTPLLGSIDEVRISDIARGPNDFLFVPEPGTLSLLALGGLGLWRRRRKR